MWLQLVPHWESQTSCDLIHKCTLKKNPVSPGTKLQMRAKRTLPDGNDCDICQKEKSVGELESFDGN